MKIRAPTSSKELPYNELLPLLVLALLVCGASGCATPYRAYRGFPPPTGGYSDMRLDASTFQVTFGGNGYTARQTVETYLLYRCAEVTAAAGYDYFVVVGASTGGTPIYWSIPGHYHSTTQFSGATSSVGSATEFSGTASTTGTYSPPREMRLGQRLTSSAVIKAFKGEKPADSPSAFDSHEVLQYLGPSVGR